MKIATLFLFLCLPVMGLDVQVSFIPNEHDEALGIVKEYSLYYRSVTEPDTNVHKWVGRCLVGQSAISFNATNIPTQCYLFITAGGISTASPYSDPYFYNLTNLMAQLPLQKVNGLKAVIK